MRNHAHLSAMVCFVSKHVAEHLRPNRSGPGKTVSQEFFDLPLAAQRLSQHLRAVGSAPRQSRTSLFRCAICSIELCRNIQVRRIKPDPLRAYIVHMRKDRRNAANTTGRFSVPRDRVKFFDKHLVDAIVGSKDLRCSLPRPTRNFVLTHGHESPLLDLVYHRAKRSTRAN